MNIEKQIEILCREIVERRQRIRYLLAHAQEPKASIDFTGLSHEQGVEAVKLFLENQLLSASK